MAELSDDDRRKILGERYKEIEEAALKSSGMLDEDRVRNARKLKAEANKLNALAVGAVGFILLVSNYYAMSGPSIALVTAFAAALCVIGGAWYARQIIVLRQVAA